MTVPDLLLAFLATAVTLAGFTGIVTFIDRGAARVSPELISFRLRSLILVAVSTIMLSVLPLLATLLVPGSDVWPLACALQAGWAAYYIARTVRIRRTFQGESAHGIHLGQYYVAMAAGIGTIGILSAGTLGYLPADASYATGVFWFLMLVVSFFRRLVFVLDDSLKNSSV
jgi:hypothetical protein